MIKGRELETKYADMFKIHLKGEEDDYPLLLDVSTFLYDLNLLYEISVLATSNKYYEFNFSSFINQRNGRPLQKVDRLSVKSLKHQSPIDIVLTVSTTAAAIGGIWGLVQVVEKIVNMPLSRRKLKAEVEKLELENAEKAELRRQLAFEEPEKLELEMKNRNADTYFNNTAKRLEKSKIRIREIEVEIERRVDADDLKQD